MSQNRKPPAYQEYASELLANKNFRLMSLAERGLLYTLKLECWANVTVPGEMSLLAKYLGITSNEISVAYTDRIKSFVEINEDDLSIPELNDYRKYLNEIRAKQSSGGKNGARVTNNKLAKNVSALINLSANMATDSQVTRQDSNESLVKFNTAKSKKAQSIIKPNTKKFNNHSSWVNEYEKESNGD